MISLPSNIQDSITTRPLNVVLASNTFLKLHGSSTLVIKTDDDPDDSLWRKEPLSLKD